jgi:hypothetical protein
MAGVLNTQLGGSTFTGRAVYDQGITGKIGTTDDTIAEDVSPIVSMISPYETPLLTLIGDAEFPAQSILHEWLEDSLNINELTVSAAALDGSATGLVVLSGANSLMLGTLLETATGEVIQVVARASDTAVTIERAVGGSTAAAIAASSTLTVLGESTTEGADVREDISKTRVRKTNTCQIFKKDVIVSGTMRSVRNLGGIVDELDYQVQMRTREALRDLEKMVIRGRGAATGASGNAVAGSAGAATASRTMQGIRSMIDTNKPTSVVMDNSSGVNLNTVIKTAWDNGGTDLDVIVCGAEVKEAIDRLNSSRIRVVNEENAYRDVVTTYESTYGSLAVVLSRWMPADEGLILAKNRIKVVPLSGRSFQFQPVAKTGDSSKGMVLGEYTVELRNEEGMARFTKAA